MSQRFRRVLLPRRTHQFALWQRWHARRGNCMQHSSILRLCTPNRECRCFQILFIRSAAVRVTGRCLLSWKQRLLCFARRWAAAKCSARFQVVLIRRWQRYCSLKRLETSLPACLSIMVCCAKTRGTKSRRFSDQAVHTS